MYNVKGMKREYIPLSIIIHFQLLILVMFLYLQESVQAVQPFLGGAKEAILLRDTLLTVSSMGIDQSIQVSAEVR